MRVSRRPHIGLTCYAEPASWGVWQQVPAVLIPVGYVAMLQDAGAQALLIPPEQGLDDQAAADLVARLDGLVIAGGVDVDPTRYGELPHSSVQTSRADRDDAELALVRAAMAVDLPLLGVCRGMQVMAVAAGGVLEQHLPDRLQHEGHAPAPGVYGRHAVRTAAGSVLRGILGEQVVVPSYHHQGVLSAPGYVESAWADDGVLEGFESPTARWRVGVQWHPEAGDDRHLFEALVRAARRV